MASSEERLRILQMVADGRITVEEGARLLEALRAGEAPEQAPPPPPPRWLRVRVTDLSSGRDRVNINIPVGLVDVGLKMGARFVDESAGIDLGELTKAIQSGRRGKLLDVENPVEGERVEIFLE
jgi:hypothetical protein